MQLNQQLNVLNETQYIDEYQQSSANIVSDQHDNYVDENVSKFCIFGSNSNILLVVKMINYYKLVYQ